MHCYSSKMVLGEILRCPWDQWSFDIASGRCLVNPRIRAKTYPVKIDGDDIVVEYEGQGNYPRFHKRGTAVARVREKRQSQIAKKRPIFKHTLRRKDVY